MLQGAFAPPYCPALPAHRLGSISLCGGARSNCAQPQNMSWGKNMRSSAPGTCQAPCELAWEVACEFACEVLPAAREVEVCAPVTPEISASNARIQVHAFISPPVNFAKRANRPPTSKRQQVWPDAFGSNRAEHCNPCPATG